VLASSEGVVELDGACGFGFLAGEGFFVGYLAGFTNASVAGGEGGVGLGVVGIGFERVVEQGDGAVAVVGVEQEDAAQVGVLGFGNDGARACEARLLLRGHGDADFVGDGLGDFSLECQDAGHVADVFVSPDGAVGLGVDELGADADFAAFAEDAALDDAVDGEFFGDFGQGFVGALVAHGGGEGDDAQGGDLTEAVDELFGHAVGEVLLGRVAGEVFEWQDGDGADVFAGACVAPPDQQGGYGDDRQEDCGEGNPAPAEPGVSNWSREWSVFRRLDGLWSRDFECCGSSGIGNGDRGWDGVRMWRESGDWPSVRGGFEEETGDVGAGGDLDADGGVAVDFEIKLGEFFADFGGFDADDGVAAGVVVDGAAEHFGADHAFAQAFDFAFEGVADDELEEILSALAAGEGVALGYQLEVVAHQSDLLRGEDIGLPSRKWIDCEHVPPGIRLRPNYNTGAIGLSTPEQTGVVWEQTWLAGRVLIWLSYR
jgi:hypothetical protein